jgi:hypothetical protein
MSSIRGQKYCEKPSLVPSSSTISSISLSRLQNEHHQWTQLSWGLFIGHVMFHHLLNLALSSSKCAEDVNQTIVRNLQSSCHLPSSNQSGFLFFKMSRIGEQNHSEKYSLVTSCSMILSISHSDRPNEHNTWTELFWGIFICPGMFDLLIDLAFSSSKWPA